MQLMSKIIEPTVQLYATLIACATSLASKNTQALQKTLSFAFINKSRAAHASAFLEERIGL